MRGKREENYFVPLMLPSSLSSNMISKPERGRPNMVKMKLELNTEKAIIRKHLAF